MYDTQNNNPKTKPGKTRINQQKPDKPAQTSVSSTTLRTATTYKNLTIIILQK